MRPRHLQTAPCPTLPRKQCTAVTGAEILKLYVQNTPTPRLLGGRPGLKGPTVLSNPPRPWVRGSRGVAAWQTTTDKVPQSATCVSDMGQAAPPMLAIFRWCSFRPASLRCCSRPRNTVGTAAAKLQRCCSRSWYSESPSRKGPVQAAHACKQGWAYAAKSHAAALSSGGRQHAALEERLWPPHAIAAAPNCSWQVPVRYVLGVHAGQHQMIATHARRYTTSRVAPFRPSSAS